MIYKCYLVSDLREKDLSRIGLKLHQITNNSMKNKGSKLKIW